MKKRQLFSKKGNRNKELDWLDLDEEDFDDAYYEEEEYEVDDEYYEDEEYYADEEDGEYYEDEADDGYYEDEEYYEEEADDEYYEDEEYDEYEGYEDSYDEDEEEARYVAAHRRKHTRGLKGVLEKLMGLSLVDHVVMVTGVLVVILLIVTGSLYLGAKSDQKQLSAFHEIGVGLEDMDVIGGKGLLAIADAESAKLMAAIEEEEIQEQEEAIKNDEEAQIVMNVTSIQRDMKIKFVNSTTDKLISGIDFEVNIKNASGGELTKKDDDRDGVIYLTGMKSGKYTVTLVSPMENENYRLPKEPVIITVREEIEYKKVDVANEIKSEAQVNVAAEDTKVNETTVESVNKDTVEWVESTKTLIEGTEKSEDTYEALDKNKIADPGKGASLVLNASMIRPVKLMSEVPGGNTGESGGGGTTGGNEGSGTTGGNEGGGNTGESGEGGTTGGDESGGNTGGGESGGTTGGNESGGTTGGNEGGGTTGGDESGGNTGGGESGGNTGGSGEPEKPAATATPTQVPAATAMQTPAATATQTPAATATATATTTPTVSPSVTPSVTPSASPSKADQAKNDTKTTLKSTDGKVVYIKDADGNFREAKYADYYTNTTFYLKSSKTTGEYRYTGWQVLDGVTYFFDKNGNKVTGEQVIQGAKYNFNSDGSLNSGSGHMGIDVSKWNGNIDWNAVKNSGVSYVIIRCGYRGSTTGALIEDPKFKSNIQGAQNAGLKVGVYFFTQAVNEVEAVEEASMALSLIRGYNITYPVFLDVEASHGRGDTIDAATRTKVCRAFCQTIQNSGYKAGIYANKTWFTSYMDAPSLTGYKIWLAQYAATPTYTKTRYDMWQYSSKGSVAGIGGYVDMNISYMGY